ncbi:uncharacterized protein [Drosophila kikkawai]|uniref:Uncharacterized protein n=1 Tax=Drosophila kikkawai TaxID=30033 RepID=A0A6P4JDW9_DROKI|nr:uncharacterized protein LOC108082346 [Drosophila kikkawai]KAH8337045.1 hypothetical protein KR059_012677 [Drosophila kikkawai]
MYLIRNSKYLQLAIGFLGIIIPLATMGIPYKYQTSVLDILRPIELVASGLLIFGLLKQQSLHKKEIILTWLICSLAFIAGILYNFLQYTWRFFADETSMIISGILLAVSALMCGMMYVMYNSYVKLIDDSDEKLLPA